PARPRRALGGRPGLRRQPRRLRGAPGRPRRRRGAPQGAGRARAGLRRGTLSLAEHHAALPRVPRPGVRSGERRPDGRGPGGSRATRLMNRQEYERSFAYEGTHWWFRAKRALVLAMIMRHGPKDGRGLDVGCGTGGMLQALAGHGRWVGSDA